MALKNFFYFFLAVAGLAGGLIFFNSRALSVEVAATSEKMPADQVVFSRGEVTIYQNGQLQWHFKTAKLSIKDAPDLIYLAGISDGVFYDTNSSKPILTGIQGQGISIHTKTREIKFQNFQAFLTLESGQNLEISGLDYVFEPLNNLSVIRGQCFLKTGSQILETKKVTFSQEKRALLTTEAVILKSGDNFFKTRGFNGNLKSQKIVFPRPIKARGTNYSFEAGAGEFDLKNNLLKLEAGPKKQFKTTIFEGTEQLTIQAPGALLNPRNETIVFGNLIQLTTPRTKISARELTFFKKEKKLLLKGGVKIKKSGREYIECSEASYLIDKKFLKIIGPVHSQIILEKDSAAETFF